MTIKASGRSALILASGLWICFSAPSQAAADDGPAASPPTSTAAPLSLGKYAKHAAHKKVAQHKSTKAAQKSPTDTKTATDETAASATPGYNDDQAPTGNGTLPAAIANANAKMASADAPDGSAQAMSVRASNILQNNSTSISADTPASSDVHSADTQVVAADQLNDVDRALHENSPDTQRPVTLAMASAEPQTTAANNDNNNWDETSLIGKIFIGFGALLTLASAARMFMA